MIGPLIAMAVLAGACAYLVGHAFVAPRASLLRTPPGGMLLAGCVLVALAGPSLLADVITKGGDWPGGFGPGDFRALWVALEVAGLLAGMRVWRMRLFSGGGLGVFGLDESPVSRAEAELPLAASLTDALDVLAREKVTARDVARLATVLKRCGARHFHQLPEKQSELYALVARHVPPAIAADVTGLLLQGAGRK